MNPESGRSCRYGIAIRTVGKNDFLERTLASIFRQTVKADEILLVIPDDVEPWPVEHPDVWFVRAGRGMVSQRAQGIRSARNALLVLMDDDIVLEEDALRVLLSVMPGSGAACVVPYWSDGWPKRPATRMLSAFWGFAMARRDGGIRYSPGGGYYFPLSEPPETGWETQGGGGALIAIDRDFAIANGTLGDVDFQKVSAYALRDDGAFIYSITLKGGKSLMVPGVRFTHLGGTTRLSGKRQFMEFKSHIVNQHLFWSRYILPQYRGTLGGRIVAGASFYRYMVGIASLALISALRSRTLDPLKGLRDGFASLRGPG